MGPVITTPAHLQAALGGRVAEQAGEAQRQGSHAQVSEAAVRLRTGAWVIRVRAPVVIIGAVVENALDQAHAGPVLHHALRGAEALPVAGQAGGQSPGGCTLSTLALATLFANELVLGGVLFQGTLQVLHKQLLGLGPDDPI